MANDAWSSMVGQPMILGRPEILGDPAAAVTAVTEADAQVVKYIQEGKYVASDRIRVGVGAMRTLAAGATDTFETQVNTPFKPEIVCVASYLQPGLTIDSLTIGATNLIDGDPVDTACWSEVSQQARVSFPTVITSQKIIAKLTNHDTVAKPFVSINMQGIRLRN